MPESIFHKREPWLLDEVESGRVEPWQQRAPKALVENREVLSFSSLRYLRLVPGLVTVERIPEGLSFSYSSTEEFDGIWPLYERPPVLMRFNGLKISDAWPREIAFYLDGEVVNHAVSARAQAVAAFAANMEFSDKLETFLLEK